jgi:hypothetical protein
VSKSGSIRVSAKVQCRLAERGWGRTPEISRRVSGGRIRCLSAVTLIGIGQRNFSIEFRIEVAPEITILEHLVIEFVNKSRVTFKLKTTTGVSVQAELDVFIGHLRDRSWLVRTMSEPAFAQARAKLSLTAIPALTDWLVARAEQYGFVPRWGGLRLVAADASTMRLGLRASHVKRDYMNLDKPRISTIYVDLPDATRKLYDELETEFITKVAGTGIRALNTATLLLQVSSGAICTAVGAAVYFELHDWTPWKASWRSYVVSSCSWCSSSNPTSTV